MCTSDSQGLKYNCPALVNECATANGGCNNGSLCVQRNRVVSCVCQIGYAATNGSACFDVNECATGSGGCSEQAVCINSPGSFSCSCKPGYTGDGASRCFDLNECEGGHICDPQYGQCTNLVGSFRCACQKGYTGDGSICAQVFLRNFFFFVLIGNSFSDK